jgi:enediyne biosynthesis protein E4
MTLRGGSLRRYAARATALILVFVFYGLARLPAAPEAELERLAASFRAAPLPTLDGEKPKSIREVNPSLRRIAGWVSSVGAAVALNDLDGDGLPNDVCYVDTRIDKIIVAPVPGTAQRYDPFTLDAHPLAYNAATTAPMGCLPGDFNEDGLIDLLAYYWGRTPIAFIRQGGAGVALAAAHSGGSYVPHELVSGGRRWYTNAATQADLDGDGHLDLIIGNYFPEGARILDARAEVPDTMNESMSFSANGGGAQFLLWKRPDAGATSGVRFEEASGVLDAVVGRGWTLAIGAADLDGDLLPEVYLAQDFGPDRLLHNRSTPGAVRFGLLEGRRGLMTPKSKVLGHDSFKGMGVDFADLNGDGWADIYVSNIAKEYALEESHFAFLSSGRVEQMKEGIAPYEESSESLGLARSGWGWEARLADFNNDGAPEALQATGFLKGSSNRWPDLHELAMGNDQLVKDPRSWPAFLPGADLSGHEHNPFFVRASDGRFHDVAARIGLGQPMVSRGIATADVDADGLLDFAVANQWETSYFYRNEAKAAGNFLGLRLRLPPSGRETAETRVCREGAGVRPAPARPAVGAQALVLAADGGNGHSGKRSPDLLFGLGALPAGRAVTIELRWRDVRGAIHGETMQLSSGGWYTLVLGGGEGVADGCH